MVINHKLSIPPVCTTIFFFLIQCFGNKFRCVFGVYIRVDFNAKLVANKSSRMKLLTLKFKKKKSFKF